MWETMTGIAKSLPRSEVLSSSWEHSLHSPCIVCSHDAVSETQIEEMWAYSTGQSFGQWRSQEEIIPVS